MNISLHKYRLFRVLLFGAFSLMAYTQLAAQSSGVEYRVLEVKFGETATLEFVSDPPYSPQIDQYGVYPQLGIADLPGPGPLGVPGLNTLTYTPNTFQPGIDHIYIKYWKFENNQYFVVNMTVEVHILPSIVHATDDYAETNQDTPVTISVLDNDWSNSDTLMVADVPLVNHGTFSLNADKTLVTFTPAAGFSGIAHFNYTICDEDGTCDMAKVSIGVIGAVPPAFDTLQLSTTQNTPREILVNLDGFELISGPNFGIVDSSMADYPVYIPEEGFFDGTDYLTYEKVDGNNTYQLLVAIKVLDIAEPNTFVFDDYVSTTLGEAVAIDVLDNDLGGNYLNNLAVITAPSHGAVSYQGNGVYEYTPDLNYTGGVDKFVYRAFSPNNTVVEYGTVYITVSNYEPNQGTFALSTTKDVPLVIEYAVPVSNFDFMISVNPDFGTLEYFPGNNTVTINNQTFSGYNMLIYTPEPGVANVIDDFEVEYCAGMGPCPTTQIKVDVEIKDIDITANQYCVGENCVWAGDTNNDGVVDIKDILPLGLNMGEVGYARPDVNLAQWYGQFGEDWSDPFAPGDIDLKYMDADGDGIIGGLDTAVISNFYYNKHSVYPAPVNQGIDVPLYFYETAVVPLDSGDLVQLDIWLGNPDEVIAEDIYGFTFTLEYETAFVDSNSVKVDFADESWITYNSPVLHLTKKPQPGVLDAGITRTSGVSDTGYGLVAQLDFVVIEDIEGVRPQDNYLDLRLTDIVAVNSAGNSFALPDAHTRLKLRLNDELEPAQASVVLSPNPATDNLQIHLNGSGKEMQTVSIYNLMGQLVASIPVSGKSFALPVQNLPNGIYLLQVESTEGDLISEKFEILK